MAQFHIENYHLVTKNRHASAHGGLASYIHKHWNFKTRTDTIESLHWEEMFFELTNPANPSKNKFTVRNFYGPPHATVAQLKLFLNGFTQRLTMHLFFVYSFILEKLQTVFLFNKIVFIFIVIVAALLFFN